MIFFVIGSFLIGFLFGLYKNKYSINLKLLKNRVEKNQFFQDVLNNFNFNNSIYTRINNSIYITTEMNDSKIVDIVFNTDKQDINLVKSDNDVLSSEFIDKELINKFIKKINKVYKEEIEDTVEVFGMKMYRKEFEKLIDHSIEEMKKRAEEVLNRQSSEIKEIKQTNQGKFDIDEILDKINQVGIKNLTPEELSFLNNFYNDKKK